MTDPLSQAASVTPWRDADTALLEQIYELQCLSRMNAIYYERRLSRVQFLNTTLEIFIALTASGSGLATVLQEQQGPYRYIWTVLALAAAIASIVKPIFSPGKLIESFTRQQQGYHANFFALKKLAFLIRQECVITIDHHKRYDTCYDRHVQLSTEDEVAPNLTCLTDARKRTAEELPANRFWWPDNVGQVRSG